MKKIIFSGFIAGVFLLFISEVALRLTLILFPDLAAQYFEPAFNKSEDKNILYYLHPFVIAMALSWFWARFKTVLSGSLLARGIEFGLIYAAVASFPMLWLIYAAMDVSLTIVATWLVLALVQGIIAGLVFERTNP